MQHRTQMSSHENTRERYQDSSQRTLDLPVFAFVGECRIPLRKLFLTRREGRSSAAPLQRKREHSQDSSRDGEDVGCATKHVYTRHIYGQEEDDGDGESVQVGE